MAEKYYTSSKTNHQVIREYVDLFGFMSKNPNAMDIMIEEAKGTMKQWGSPDPTFLLTNSRLTFQMTMLPEKTQYLTQGIDGIKRLKGGPDIKSYRGLNIINTRMMSMEDGAPPRDILRRRVRVAEYYRIPWEDGIESKSFAFYDESKDAWQKFSWHQLFAMSHVDGTVDSSHSTRIPCIDAQWAIPQAVFDHIQLPASIHAHAEIGGLLDGADWDQVFRREFISDVSMSDLSKNAMLEAQPDAALVALQADLATETGATARLRAALAAARAAVPLVAADEAAALAAVTANTAAIARLQAAIAVARANIDADNSRNPAVQAMQQLKATGRVKMGGKDTATALLGGWTWTTYLNPANNHIPDLNAALMAFLFGQGKGLDRRTMQLLCTLDWAQHLPALLVLFFSNYGLPAGGGGGAPASPLRPAFYPRAGLAGTAYDAARGRADVLTQEGVSSDARKRVELVVVRPNIEHNMLGVVMGRGGLDDLGATLWGQTELSVYDDSMHGIWGMSYKYNERAIVYNEKNLIRLWDVAYDGYNGGKDCRVVNWSQENSSDDPNSLNSFQQATYDVNRPYEGASMMVMSFPDVVCGDVWPSPIVFYDPRHGSQDATIPLDSEHAQNINTKNFRIFNRQDYQKVCEPPPLSPVPLPCGPPRAPAS